MEWMAFYTLEAAAHDPEVTKWDTAEMIQGKLARQAKAKLGR